MLDRFLDAQRGDYAAALAEVRRGRKTSHWMWYIFPQIAGLGQSSTARYYSIRDLEEAREYYAHPVLGQRLREISGALLETATEEQEAHQEVDQWTAAVRNFVEHPVPKGWRNGWDLEKRQLYWEGSYQDPVETEERDAVCVAEIWRECLHGRIERIDTREQRRIAAALDSLDGWERATNVQRFKPYGRQRYWRKVCQQT